MTAPWTGPFGGVPPFNAVKLDDFHTTIEAAISAAEAEIAAIASNPEPASFDNTIAAREQVGAELDRVLTLYHVWAGTMSTPDFQQIERTLEPRLAAFWSSVSQRPDLAARIDAVLDTGTAEADQLDPAQRRLAETYQHEARQNGAHLDEATRARVGEINERLASLFTEFGQNVLTDEENQHVLVTDETRLAGLPQGAIDAAVTAAEAAGQAGWRIANTRSSVDPVLASAHDRALREEVWRMFVSRADGSEHSGTNNGPIMAEILAVRAERAKLLGFADHAEFRLGRSMAATAERTMQLMESVWPAARARVADEVAEMQALADEEAGAGGPITIEPWDYRFYMEKLRQSRYDLDKSELAPYLSLDQLREGMFWVAGQLFGFAFAPTDGLPVAHPDISVFEVTNRDSGEHVGLWYFDPFARAGKRSGAWMSQYRQQQRLTGDITTIVSNNSNFVKPGPGKPVLISWDDATTLFHEFGHALHGLNSDVTYPSQSGTNVARDYVEFPSQLLEHWLPTPEVLERFARHHETGEPIPQELRDKLEAAATFGQGFATVEYLSCALLDMRLHTTDAPPNDLAAFEAEALATIGMPKEIAMRHRLPHFLHIFATDGYSAGYYSYLWADTLTADAWEAFTEAGGPYDDDVAQRLRANVFQAGDTVDPLDAYRSFRGRDADPAALMRKRGFAA